MRLATIFTVISLVVGSAASARADAPASPSTDPGVLADAHAGRAWLMPTALTPPAGTFSISDRELLVIAASYAITDRLHVSAAGMLPGPFELTVAGFGSVKYQLVRVGRLRGALQGSLIYVTTPNKTDDTPATMGHLGGVATVCIDRGCHSQVSGYVGGAVTREVQSTASLFLGGSATVQIVPHVKLVVEGDRGFASGDIEATDNRYLLWYGGRLTSRSLALDLGLVRNEDMGAVFASITYRHLGR